MYIYVSFSASRIRYEITSGNIGGAFAVKNMTGAIYVAGALDYETRKRVSTIVINETNKNTRELDDSYYIQLKLSTEITSKLLWSINQELFNCKILKINFIFARKLEKQNIYISRKNKIISRMHTGRWFLYAYAPFTFILRSNIKGFKAYFYLSPH